MRRLFRVALSLVGLLAFLWVLFMVPLGRRTLWEHITRVAATPAAQEMGSELGRAGEDLADEVVNQVDRLRRDAGAEAGQADPGDDRGSGGRSK